MAALLKEYKGIRDALFPEPEDKGGQSSGEEDNTLYNCEFRTAPIQEMCYNLDRILSKISGKRVKTFLLKKHTFQLILNDEQRKEKK